MKTIIRSLLAPVTWAIGIIFVSWMIVACGSGVATPVVNTATPVTPSFDDVPRAGRLNLKDLADQVSKIPLSPIWSEIQTSIGIELLVTPVEGTTAEDRLRKARALMDGFAHRFSNTPSDWLPWSWLPWSEGIGALRETEEIAFDTNAPQEVKVAAIVQLWQFYGAVSTSTQFESVSHNIEVLRELRGVDDRGLAILELTHILWNRAAAARDAAAAEILRTGQPKDAVLDVLKYLTEHADGEERHDDALRLAEEVLRLLDHETATEWWIWLAGHYYINLDIGRGDIALRRAGVDPSAPPSASLDIELVDYLDGAANLRAAAIELATMPPLGAPVENDISRAWCLLRLGRYSETSNLVKKLARAFPNDARVVTLETWIAVSAFRNASSKELTSTTFVQENLGPILERASTFSHRNATYYETAIWTKWASQVEKSMERWSRKKGAAFVEVTKADLRTILAQFDSPEMKLLIKEYRELSPARAAVITETADLFLVLSVLKSAPMAERISVLRERSSIFLALTKEHPEQTDAWRIASVLAWIGEDRAAWIELMRSEASVPEEDKPLVSAWQARGLLYIAAAAGNEQLLNEADARMAEASVASLQARKELVCPRADVATLNAVLHDAESYWSRAVDAIDACLVTTLSAPERARLVSNWAFCQARSNRVKAAIVAWNGASATTTGARWRIAVNLAATRLEHASTSEAVEAMRSAAADRLPFDENVENKEWARWLFWFFGNAGKPFDQVQIASRIADLDTVPTAIEEPWHDRDVHFAAEHGRFEFSLDVLHAVALPELGNPFEVWLYPSAPVTDEEIEKIRKESKNLLDSSESGAKPAQSKAVSAKKKSKP